VLAAALCTDSACCIERTLLMWLLRRAHIVAVPATLCAHDCLPCRAVVCCRAGHAVRTLLLCLPFHFVHGCPACCIVHTVPLCLPCCAQVLLLIRSPKGGTQLSCDGTCKCCCCCGSWKIAGQLPNAAVPMHVLLVSGCAVRDPRLWSGLLLRNQLQ
jgi:hypothetical protein